MFEIPLAGDTWYYREGTRNDVNIDITVAYVNKAGNLLAHRLEDEDDYDG